MDPNMSSANGQGGYVAVAFTCDTCSRNCTRFTRGDPNLLRHCSSSCENESMRRASDKILSMALDPASKARNEVHGPDLARRP